MTYQAYMSIYSHITMVIFFCQCLVRPVVLLAGAIALAILCPQAALPIAVCTVAGAALGGIKASFEKPSPENMDFEQFQKTYGAKPNDVAFISPDNFDAAAGKKDVEGLLWYMMREACERGEAFTEGTFVIERSAREIYNILATVDGAYEKISSHYKGRITEGTRQRGLDFETPLLADKRTILFGLTDTHNGNQTLFIKPENWGADHSIKNVGKLKHLVNHTIQFIHAQYVKIMRPGYDDQPNTAKERIPHAWGNVSEFGWAKLTAKQKADLIHQGLASEAWGQDTYRTG